MDRKSGHEKEKETASAGFCLSLIISPKMHLRIVVGVEYMRPFFQFLFSLVTFYIKLLSIVGGYLGLVFLTSSALYIVSVLLDFICYCIFIKLTDVIRFFFHGNV